MTTDPAAAQITEPMTMLTDYVLVALAVTFAWQLRLHAGSFAAGSVGWWCLAFSVAALAALAGGTAHGFRLYLGEEPHAWVWQLTVVSIILSVALTLGAAIRSVLRPSIGPGERRKAGHGWLKRGLYVTLAGVVVQRSGWGFSEHFNHNDIYHLIQMAGLYCLYRGALVLDGLDRPT